MTGGLGDWDGSDVGYSAEPTPAMPGTPVISAQSQFSPTTIINPDGNQPFRNLAIRGFARGDYYPLPGLAQGKSLAAFRIHQLDGSTFDFVGTRESIAAFGRWLAAEASAK